MTAILTVTNVHNVAQITASIHDLDTFVSVSLSARPLDEGGSSGHEVAFFVQRDPETLRTHADIFRSLATQLDELAERLAKLEEAHLDPAAVLATARAEWDTEDGYTIDVAVSEWANCREAEVDETGYVWIADPQAGHNLDREELTSLVEWMRGRDLLPTDLRGRVREDEETP